MRFLLFYRKHPAQKMTDSMQSGFTLIELLLIVVMIGVLSIAAINAFDGNEEQARENITRLEMAELQKALLQFRRDNRELPCMVYRLGNYYPDDSNMTRLDLTDLPSSPSASESANWCDDSLKNAEDDDIVQADNGLSILNKFPYPITTINTDLMWNQGIQRGWNGPYISEEGLFDGWGNRYRLLNPELSYSHVYRCLADGINYDIDGDDLYTCESPDLNNLNWDVDFTLPADIARIVSNGPNGKLDTVFDPDPSKDEDPCVAKGDDLVLCLLR